MQIPVFYSEQMVADSMGFSPSAGKPTEVVQSWQALGLPLQILPPTPASRTQLERAHERWYVQGVLDGSIQNGFGNHSPQVAASLPYTCGAMIDACLAALHNRTAAVAPCSGFHHAGYDFGGGFCTFNGLMVAALDLLMTGKAAKVGILDLDMHWGNGTADIIQKRGLGQVVVHDSRSVSQHRAEAFLDQLAQDIRQRFADCDLLIYQAGADSHIDDPLGGYLTTAQMLRRDQIVFATCRELGLPVAWNLAGGYQRDDNDSIRPVLDLHDNTMKAHAHTFLLEAAA